jgi:outer membrane protein
MKKLILLIILISTYSLNVFAENTRFIDYNKLLNISKAGATAQDKLQKKFKSESEKFTKLERDIKKQESEIISQKTALGPEEYKKKVNVLRKKVADLQKNKQNSFNAIAKSRTKARQDLLKSVNPIIKKYMEENKISMIFDKQAVVMGDTKLEITDKIVEILNKELPTLKIN